MRGDLFGMLSAHSLSPLLSLHHLDAVEPIVPNMNRTQALGHLFKAVEVDPARILQQTVCYDRSRQLTVSVAWGYAIQVYEGNEFLPDLLSLQRTFTPWKRGANVDSHFMFNMRDYPRDLCKRPIVFFLESVISDKSGVLSNYIKHVVGDCVRAHALENLELIRVLSQKVELDVEEVCFGGQHLKNSTVDFLSCYFHILISFAIFLYKFYHLYFRWNLLAVSAVTFLLLLTNQ